MWSNCFPKCVQKLSKRYPNKETYFRRKQIVPEAPVYIFAEVVCLDIKRSTLIVLSPSLFPSIDLNCQGQKSYHQRKEPIWGSFLQKILRREREFRGGLALPYGGDVERG